MSDISFKTLGLVDAVLKSVEEAGFKTPTPIQAQAIPEILSGKDVLASAQTGSGKTAAYLLPIMNKLMAGRSRARMPRALVLIPTRELAQQVVDGFEKFAKDLKLKCTILIGGEFIGSQEKELEKGIDVLIATPGRLLDIIERGKVMLLDTKILVIDEADKMMDMGFFPVIEKLLTYLPAKRQNIFLSATMPKEIKREAEKLLTNPVEIMIARDTKHMEAIVQEVIKTPVKSKRKHLEDLLKRADLKTVIVFCNKKVSATNLCTALKKDGFKAGMLHGDMTQMKRTETLAEFKKGDINILVASDVAARGIDVENLSHVINYDVPMSAEDYTHRIGRTGRAGNLGVAVTFVTPTDEKAWAAIEQTFAAGKTAPKAPAQKSEPRHKPEPKAKDKTELKPVRQPEQQAKTEHKPTHAPKPTPKPDVDLPSLPPNNKPAFGDDVPAFFKVNLTGK